VTRLGSGCKVKAMPNRHTRLGPYQVLGTLGRGGMGTVYRALQEPLNRPIALKIVDVDPRSDAKSLNRFMREIRLAGRFAHPNVVRVYDAGCLDGHYYIAMELVEGTDLFTAAAEKPLPWQEACAITGQLASALQYLHDQRLLHRDVKPQNALLGSDGVVKLVDFGLARRIDSTMLTEDGVRVGSPRYMAPELFLGADFGEASDLWGLGYVLYWLTTAQDPIPAGNQEQWLDDLLHARIRDPRIYTPSLPLEVVNLILNLLEPIPEKRLASAGSARQRLDALTPRRTRAVEPAGRTNGSERLQLREGRTSRFRLPLVAAIGFGALALAFRGTRPPFAPDDRNAPATTAVGRAAVSRPPTAVTAWRQWRTFRDTRIHLSGRGHEVALAVAQLRRSSPIDFGKREFGWLSWFAMGAWLEGSSRRTEPPVLTDQISGISTDFLPGILLNRLDKALQLPHPEYFREILVAVMEFPQDPRCWLAFAHALELDGDWSEARMAFAEANRHSKGLSMRKAPPWLWSALAGMEKLYCDATLEDDWLRHIRTDEPSQIPWEILEHELPGTRFERLLERAASDRELGEGVAMFQGRRQVRCGDCRKAFEIWQAFLRVRPEASQVRELLATHLFTVGRVPEASAVTQPLGATHPLSRQLVRLSGPLSPSFDSLSDSGLPDWPIRAGIDAARYLDVGQLEPAGAILKRALPSPRLHEIQWLVPALVGAGSRDSTHLDAFRRMIQRTLDWETACEIIDGLARSDDMVYVEEFLHAYRRVSADPGATELLRALWLSKRGRGVDSLPCLQTATASRLRSEQLLTCVEVWSRLIWMDLLRGIRPGRGKPGRPPETDVPMIGRYVGLLWQGQWREAAGVAEVLYDQAQIRRPTHWGLCPLWSAVLSGEEQSIQLWTARLRASALFTGRGHWLLCDLARLEKTVARSSPTADSRLH
jgi:hypothetical protein